MGFVTVKHGANEQTLFNHDCRSITLLNAIREKCSLSADDIIDLSDRDGNVKDLRMFPNRIAKDVLADREDFVLLRVGENDKGKPVYTPLLECEEIVTKAFREHLDKSSKRDSNAGKIPKSFASSANSSHPPPTSSTAAARRAEAATSSASSTGKRAAPLQPPAPAGGQQKKR